MQFHMPCAERRFLQGTRGDADLRREVLAMEGPTWTPALDQFIELLDYRGAGQNTGSILGRSGTSFSQTERLHQKSK